MEKHNCVYKLDAIDAFEMNLVKQIEVASFTASGYHNRAYMLLKSVDNKKSPITAKIEIDALVKGEVKRKVVTVKQGSDISEKLSGNRSIYEGYIVDEIYCEKGEEYVSFTMKPEILRIGRAVGDIDDTAIKEQQIRKTIEEHLNKELILSSKGIKVLSFLKNIIKSLSNVQNIKSLLMQSLSATMKPLYIMDIFLWIKREFSRIPTEQQRLMMMFITLL